MNGSDNNDVKKYPAIDFPEDVRRIIFRLIDSGYDSYAVGGCIRDTILGKTPNDWDITTAASPEEVIKLFSEGDIHIISTAGIRHGTVMLKSESDVYEVTTFRCDGNYTDHRHPDEVLFSNDIEDDLERRDFTINAIAAKPTDAGCLIVDPFGGIDDINNRIIRTVGSAKQRFDEDALRILRALRFASCLDFNIESETADAILRYYPTLCYIASERITSELWRFLEGDNAPCIVKNFRDVFDWITPLKVSERFIEHIDKTRDPYVRLAIMLDHGSDPTEFFSQMRFRGETMRFVRGLLSLECAPENRVDVCSIMRRFGERIPAVADYMQILVYEGIIDTGLTGADLIEESKGIIADGVPYLLPQLAVNGSDVIGAGVDRIKVGDVLEYLLEQVQLGSVRNEREVLLLQIPSEYKTE